MVTMPALGAYADLRAREEAPARDHHRRLRAGDRARWPAPGRATWRWRSLAIVLSNVVLLATASRSTAAFLPELARPDAMGRVSGWGWSFGYFGGMLSLGLCLGYVLWAQARGPAGDRSSCR